MSTYDGIAPPTRLDRAVDAAVAEENARPITADEQHTIEVTVTAWEALAAAEFAAASHGVVLPIATARAVLAVLNGDSPAPLTPRLVEATLRYRIEQAERKS